MEEVDLSFAFLGNVMKAEISKAGGGGNGKTRSFSRDTTRIGNDGGEGEGIIDGRTAESKDKGVVTRAELINNIFYA